MLINAAYTNFINQLSSLGKELIAIPIQLASLIHKSFTYFLELFQHQEFIEIIEQILFLIAVIYFPFFIFKLVKNKLRKIKQQHNIFFQKKDIEENNWFFIIQRTSSYLPWFATFISLVVLEKILEHSIWKPWIFLLDYFLLYALYKLLFILFSKYYSKKKNVIFDTHKKIQALISFWAKLILIASSLYITFKLPLLKLSATSISLLNKTLFYVIIAIFISSCWRWKNEIIKGLTSLPFAGEYFHFLSGSRWKFLLLPFLTPFLILKIFTEIILSLFSDFDLIQKFSNKIFKTRIKDVSDKNSSLAAYIPQTYQNLFDDSSPSDPRIKIAFPSGEIEHIFSILNEWFNNREIGNSLAIIGDKGSGKTTFLKKIINSPQFLNSRVEYLSINKKLTTPNSIHKLIRKIFNIDFNGSFSSFLEFDEDLEPTIIVLDNAHNLFLAMEDGLEGLKYLINLINLQTKNIFWITAFNHHSWLYLNNVLGRYRFFRNEYFMPRWKEEEITSLIKKAHSYSDYNLSFDFITEALSNNEENLFDSIEIQNKFYRFITDQSDGNPKRAQALWLSSLRATSYKKLQISFPHEKNIGKFLSELQDSALFILAALLRHENLTSFEIAQVTSLPKGIVANTLKMGIEEKLLKKNLTNRYRISINYIDRLTSFLAKKNFIYE